MSAGTANRRIKKPKAASARLFALLPAAAALALGLALGAGAPSPSPAKASSFSPAAAPSPASAGASSFSPAKASAASLSKAISKAIKKALSKAWSGFGPALAAAAEPSLKNPFNICVFHITDEKDSPTEAYNTKKLQERIGQFHNSVKSNFDLKSSVKVKAYGVEEKDNIRRAFREMAGGKCSRLLNEKKEKCKEKAKCDSLMISGNHMGHFYGKEKALFLKDLEEMACDKDLKDWFNGIKALWLHGSGTVTDDLLAHHRNKELGRSDKKDHRYAEDESDKRTREYLSGMDQKIQDPIRTAHIQHAYKASIDEDSPLSSRYLRSFPNAQIYGFFGNAPTSEDLADKSSGIPGAPAGQSHLFHHIVGIGEAIDENLIEKNGKAFVEGIKALAANEKAENCEKIRAKAWEKDTHLEGQSVYGKSYGGIRQLGCDLIHAKQVLEDPDAGQNKKNAAKQKIKNTLDKINTLDGLLNEDKTLTNEKITEIFGENANIENIKKEIKQLKDDRLKASHLLFSNIYDTWKLAGAADDSGFQNEVKKKLQENSFKAALNDKIESLVQPVLAKADYLKFCEEISCGADVQTKANEILDTQINVASNNTGSRILAVSAIDQLNQYGLIEDDRASKLAANESLFPADSSPYIKQIQKGLEYQGKNAAAILSDVGQAKTKAVKDSASADDKAAYNLALRTAARNFFRNGDAENFSQAIQTIPAGQDKEAALTSLAKDTLFYAQLDNNPEKQAKDLFRHIKDMKKRNGNFNQDTWNVIVNAAASMPEESRHFFYTQFDPNPKKQAKVLFHHIENMTSSQYDRYTLNTIVRAAKAMQEESRLAFVSQMKKTASNFPYKQQIINIVKQGVK